ncbi:MAG: DegT/DnrJ/EryC1/StrS family aminotransferase, partial [Opitutales bacterium]
GTVVRIEVAGFVRDGRSHAVAGRPDTNRDRCSRRRIVDRVLDQIDQHRPQKAPIRAGHDRRELKRARETALRGTAGEAFPDVVRHRRQVDPFPLHRQQCFVDHKYRGFDRVPVAEQLAAEVLSIPVFPELTAEQRQWVADSLADFAAGKSE